MLTKRQFIVGGLAMAAGGIFAIPAQAEMNLLDDILIGVTDAVVRDYIRSHYRDSARWDGHYWIVNEHRYRPREYAVYLERRYYDHHPHYHHPEHPVHPEHPGKGHGKKKGHHKHDKFD